MRKIASEQTQEYKNSDLCIAKEYDFKDKDIDISTAKISGRYPENGYCVNTEVKEMIFILAGGCALKRKLSHLNKAMQF